MFGLIKYILFSLFVSAFTFIAAISVSTGKFPPTWSQIKGLRSNIESILALKKQLTESGGLSNLQQQFPKMALPSAANMAGEGSQSGEYTDPALEDVNEIIRHQKNQAAISNAITGEAHFGSLTPPPGNGSRQPQNETSSEVPTPEMAERVRKLEDLVSRMHDQIQRLNQEMAALKQPSQRR